MPTGISWADESWNPVTGCSKLSLGCDNCYAQRTAQRFRGRFGYPAEAPFAVTYHKNRLVLPSGWKSPKIIFVDSMGDLFHPDVQLEWIAEILVTCGQCPWHRFMILTKRPDIGASRLHACARMGVDVPPNVGLGVTVESAEFMHRLAFLRQLNSDVRYRFVSAEPLLGPLDLRGRLEHVDAVIVGGETGSSARPMAPQWARDVRDVCSEASVLFHFKQRGQYCELADATREGPAVPCGGILMMKQRGCQDPEQLDGVGYRDRLWWPT